MDKDGRRRVRVTDSVEARVGLKVEYNCFIAAAQ